MAATFVNFKPERALIILYTLLMQQEGQKATVQVEEKKK